MRDRDIRQKLHDGELRRFHEDPESLVLDEFGLCTGTTRVDVAVINGSLHGYEIKSDRDTLARLPAQVELYSRVLDHATLVVGRSHLEHACEMLPDWWGIILAKADSKQGLTLSMEREAGTNPSPDPYALVQLLWKQEALLILEAHGKAKGLASKPRKALWEVLASGFEYSDLSWLVRQALKIRRGWRDAEAQPAPPSKLPPGVTVLAHFQL